jgi:hypothetical protein
MGLNRRPSNGLVLALGAAMAAWTGADQALAQGQGQPPPVAGQPPPLSALPSILRLSPDQREAFRAYTDAIAQDRLSHQNPMDMAQSLNLMATPERLDAMVAQMKSDEAAFQRRAAATKAFYAALTPDQKQTFDAITRLPVAPPSSSPAQYRPPQSTLPQPQNPQALPPPGGSPSP